MYYDCSPAIPSSPLPQRRLAATPDGVPPSDSAEVISWLAGKTSAIEFGEVLSAGLSPEGEEHEEDFDALIGPALLIDLADATPLSAISPVPPRLLLRTAGLAPSDPAHLQSRLGELLDLLNGCDIRLIGVDVRGDQWPGSARLRSVLNERGIVFLQGLKLAEPPAGEHVLIALPIKAEGLSISPIRVILKSIY